MKLHELADDLIEIRRYVRSHPDHVKSELRRLQNHVARLHVVEEPGWGLRLACNLIAGLKGFACNEDGKCVTVVDPEILEGYLYGAAAEIRELAMREERGK